MKQRIAIIILIASVFILGVVVASISRNRQNAPRADESSVVAEDANADLSAKENEDISASYEEISDRTEEENTQEDEAAPKESDEVVEEPKVVLPEFTDILKVNPYVSGWLRIDDSVIDVPVVYTPGSQNYFLHRDIEGAENSSGTLFIAIDWEDGYNNTLIYGHNMKDGSGFGSLQKFARESYGKDHSVIHFDTLYEEKEYELYAAFYSQIDEDELETEEDRQEKDKIIEEVAIAKKEQEAKEEEKPAEEKPSEEKPAEEKPSEEKPSGEEGSEEPTPVPEPVVITLNDIDLHREFNGEDIYRQEKDEDDGRFRYYYFTDLSRKDDFDYYAKKVKENAIYDTGVDAQFGDEFITLSTCSYQVRNGRFVVVGVRKHTSE